MKRKTLPQTITIKRDESEPENMELIAKALIEIADGFRALQRTAKDKLIVLVLHDMTGVAKRDIQNILTAAPEIAARYLKGR